MATSRIYTLLISFSFVYFMPTLCADSPIKEEGTCFCTLQNNSYINLWDISSSSPGGPRFSEVPYIPVGENVTIPPDYVPISFSYDPCRPFTETDSVAETSISEKPCTDVLGCKHTPGKSDGTKAEIHAIAVPNRVKFQVDADYNFKIVYTTSSASNLTVILVCDKNTSYELKIDAVDRNNQTMTLRSRCACLDTCSKPKPEDDPDENGLSTGSILLIIFFTLLALYLIGGVTYNFCNGAQGAEMLPHAQFWNDLPQLIMDGFLFTCTCFGKRSQGNYSDL